MIGKFLGTVVNRLDKFCKKVRLWWLLSFLLRILWGLYKEEKPEEVLRGGMRIRKAQEERMNEGSFIRMSRGILISSVAIPVSSNALGPQLLPGHSQAHSSVIIG